MKTLLVMAALMIGTQGFAQTMEAEMAQLSKLLSTGKVTGQQAGEIKKSIEGFFKDGSYPKLPYDTTTKEVVFDYVMECPGVPKATIYKRIKEWCAIAYGDFETVLRYEDFETGKIVVKGYVNIPYHFTFTGMFGGEHSLPMTAKCNHGVVFTVKDNKFKFSIQQLDFNVTFDGYTAGSIYVPSRTVEYPFSGIFPLVNVAPESRKDMLELVRNTLAEFDESRASVWKYVKGVDGDYRF
jgi:hypothetical protein